MPQALGRIDKLMAKLICFSLVILGQTGCSNGSPADQERRALASSATTVLVALDAWEKDRVPTTYVARTLDAMQAKISEINTAAVTGDDSADSNSRAVITAAVHEASQSIADGSGDGARRSKQKLSDALKAYQPKPTAP